MRKLAGKIIMRRHPNIFSDVANVNFKIAWSFVLSPFLKEIEEIEPRTQFYEIIEAETGLLDVLFMCPPENEDAVWAIIMRATQACAYSKMKV